MIVKPVYNNLNGAPMKFHKFLCVTIWIGVFLNIVEAINLISIMGQAFNTYNIILLLISCANTACAFVAGIELPSMKWIGVKAYLATIFMPTLVYFNTLVFSRYYGLDLYDPMIKVIASILSGCLIFIPVYIYYGKRRNLFSPRTEMPYSSETMPGMEPDVSSPITESAEGSEADLLPPSTENLCEQEELKEETIDESGAIEDYFAEQSQDDVVEKDDHSLDDVPQNSLDAGDIRFCYKCGHEIGPDAVFCEKCGTKVR